MVHTLPRQDPQAWLNKEVAHVGTITIPAGPPGPPQGPPPGPPPEEPQGEPPSSQTWKGEPWGEPPPQEDMEEAKYCDICQMWLNGFTQFEDHKIGKKHKKSLKLQGKRAPVHESEDEITTRKLQVPMGTIILHTQEAYLADGQTESAMLQIAIEKEEQEMKDAVDKYLYGPYTELPDELDLRSS